MPVFANLVGKPDGSGRVSGIGLISVGGRPKAARCQTAIHIYRLVCLPVGLRESRGNNSGCFSTSAQTLSGISNFSLLETFGQFFGGGGQGGQELAFHGFYTWIGGPRTHRLLRS